MWTPHEVRKLLAQIAGLLFGGAGVWLVVSGVKAEGSIDITSSVLSGKLESGSAGLFLVFLGFLLLILPALFGSGHAFVSPRVTLDEAAGGQATADNGEARRYLIGTVALSALSLLLIFGGSYVVDFLEMNIGAFLIIGGIALGIVAGLMIVGGVIQWIDPNAFRDSSKDTQQGAAGDA